MAKENEKNNPENRDGPNEEQVDRLIERLEKEYSFIETMEIIHGLTPEEIEEKGFTGNKKITIQRSKFARERIGSGLQITDGIEVFYKKGIKDISKIDIADIELLPDVQPGQIIALQKYPAQQNTPSFEEFATRLGPDYPQKANVKLRPVPEGVQFIATIKGKAVFLDSKIYIITADRDAACSITVSDDHMRVYATLTPHSGSGKNLEPEMIRGLLRERGITTGIIDGEILRAVETVSREKTVLKDIVIAEGKKPVDGADASAEIFFSTDQTQEDFRILPDGHIDYHRKANITIVHKGDLLARVGLPGRGTDGYDVYGAAIPAKDGNPCTLVAGENVKVSDDGKEFLAEADGQVSRNGDVLGVFEHYLVDGDVDYGTGNIDFNGNVTVKGMVLAGFEVKATGDITIVKGIESATVIAGRDLKVHGGIFGANAAGTITCGRDLYVHHLQNTAVEVQGDVHIDNSSVQSSVYCNGKVVAIKQKGAIIGGMVHAMAGIEAKSIGSIAGTKTEICVGSDYLVQKTMGEVKNALEFYRRNIAKIDQTLSPLLQQLQKGLTLEQQKKDFLVQIMEKRKQMKKNITVMESRLKILERKAIADHSAMIKASEKIYPGVTAKISGAIKVFETPAEHCSLMLNSKSCEIETGAY